MEHEHEASNVSTVKPQRAWIPATARFRDHTERFPSTRGAFVWLVREFVSAYPSKFENLRRIPGTAGRSRRYLASTPKDLFDPKSNLADYSNFVQVKQGIYLNVLLSNAQKLRILAQLAQYLQLRSPEDWMLEIESAAQRGQQE
jgi:hypothetical protein